MLFESKDGEYKVLGEVMGELIMGGMKSKKIITLAKGVWAFCSYLFWTQRGQRVIRIFDCD